MDLSSLIATVVATNEVYRAANNVAAQFGTDDEPFLFAGLLPERTTTRNEFAETIVKHRRIVANAGTRHSPTQLKTGFVGGSINVKIGYSDIAGKLTAEDYDALVALAQQADGGNGPTFQGAAQVIDFVNAALVMPLRRINEVQRAAALFDGEIVARGDNGFSETYTFPAGPGLRVDAGGAWSDPAYDPFDDILAIAEKVGAVEAIVIPKTVAAILGRNLKVRQRLGRVVIADGVIAGVPGRATNDELNNELARNALPPLTVDDRQYDTAFGFDYYTPRDAMLFVPRTARRATVDVGADSSRALPNTLGYTAVGVPSGTNVPERRVVLQDNPLKPVHLFGEAYQATIPVLLDGEKVGTIRGIA